MQGSAKDERGAVVAVIPARFASTRFPGKPLIDLLGQPMIAHVVGRARLARRVDRVLVATDDARIAAAAEAAGAAAVLTAPELPSGTDRVAAALTGLEGLALILNVQGDEPLIDPADLDALVEGTLAAGTPMGTLARPLTDPRRLTDPHVVKVVCTLDGRALYFSRAPIPFPRAPSAEDPALQHIGVYAYRPGALRQLTAWAPSPLERLEQLEQLRALQHGLAIQVVLARSTTPSLAIDVPADVDAVLAALQRMNPSLAPPESTHA